MCVCVCVCVCVASSDFRVRISTFVLVKQVVHLGTNLQGNTIADATDKKVIRDVKIDYFFVGQDHSGRQG